MDKLRAQLPGSKLRGAIVLFWIVGLLVDFSALHARPRKQSHRRQPAQPIEQGPSALDVQVRLDQASFSPGEIDGKWGANIRKAIAAFQKSRGLKVTGTLDSATQQALSNSAPGETLVPYTITEQDVAGPFLDRIPRDLVNQSKFPGLYYTSPLEKLGEKFHISPLLLRQLNKGAKFVAGEQIKAPNLSTAQNPESGSLLSASTNGNSASKPAAQAQARRAEMNARPDVTVTVSKNESALRVETADGKIIFYAPVTSGSLHDPLPLGKWKVTGVQKNPVFHYNPNLFWDAKPKQKRADIQPGPNNPVGVVWIDINKEHYGIHGTPEPAQIGHTQSHGCVRLTNWDAMKLAALVKPGTPVFFVE
ncbi:MAG TPA: L,D-transpeptidase [Acidobacteriota bacterium]|jgi:lipoprotein-anchoring transpeptidase ErfK/SrfK